MSTEVKLRNDGLYLYRDTELLSGVERVEGDITAEWLCAQVQKPAIRMPEIRTHMETKYRSRIKAADVKRILGTIAAYPRTEVLFYLYYSLLKGDWHVSVPPQSGHGASVSAKFKVLDGIPESYYPVGTIHTHPEMGAFWSGTDRDDQEGKDGFHIVFGTRGGHVKEWKATLFTSVGNEYEKALEDILDLDGVDFAADYAPDKGWLKVLESIREAPKAAACAARLEFPGGARGMFQGFAGTAEFGVPALNGHEMTWHNTVPPSGGSSRLLERISDLLDNFDQEVARANQRNGIAAMFGESYIGDEEHLKDALDNIVTASGMDMEDIVRVAVSELAKEVGIAGAGEAVKAALADAEAEDYLKELEDKLTVNQDAKGGK